MRYGIGSLRDNQRTRSCLIWINCVWKKSVDNKALVVWPSRDFRRDMTLHDVTWRDMTWHYVTWHDVTWRCKTWHDVAWHDVALRDMTWHDVKLRDITWLDVAWRNMTRHDVAWQDMTWHDTKVDNKALMVCPFRDFRATAYKFRASLSRNECLGNLENLLNQKVTWVFEVSQT